MAVTPHDIKRLREATSAGFLACKQALEKANGDYEAAYQLIREQGLASAQRKTAATTCGALMATHRDQAGAMVELGCQTDFVARNERFQSFIKQLLQLVLDHKILDVKTLLQHQIEGQSIEEARLSLVAAMGENIQILRCTFVETAHRMISYQHGQKIGVLLAWKGEDFQLAEHLAMHVAASSPLGLSADAISQDWIERERAIALARVQQMGKTGAIADSIVEGMVNKLVDAQILGGQEFIIDPKLKVAEVLKQNHMQVDAFVRWQLGEFSEPAA